MVHRSPVILRVMRKRARRINYLSNYANVEYQETACRAAKALQVPLLCIDSVIVEGIALGDSWHSIKLRQIIDEAYREYLSAFEKYR